MKCWRMGESERYDKSSKEYVPFTLVKENQL